MRSRSRFVLVAALLALLAFTGVVTETVFVHTDDGCEVEQHCIACRVAVGGLAVQGPVVHFASCLSSLDVVAPPTCPASSAWVDPRTPSRAPPLS
jgi:hypothetical protein